MDEQLEREFSEIYNTLVRCDWNAPIMKQHVQQLEAFMGKHRELYKIKGVMDCINAAREHCRSGSVPYRF